MKLIQDNLYTEFIRLLQQTTNDLIIVTPFIKADFIENVIRQINPNVNIKILTNFSRDSFINRASDPEFVIILKENFKNVDIRHLDNLHAKIYIFDEKIALISSANLSQKAFLDNFEYSVLIDEISIIQKILKDVKTMFDKSVLIERLLKSKIVSIKNKDVRNDEEIMSVLRKYDNTFYKQHQNESNILITPFPDIFINKNPDIKIGQTLSIINDFGSEEKYKIITYRDYHFESAEKGRKILISEHSIYQSQHKIKINVLKSEEKIKREFFSKYEDRWITFYMSFIGFVNNNSEFFKILNKSEYRTSDYAIFKNYNTGSTQFFAMNNIIKQLDIWILLQSFNKNDIIEYSLSRLLDGLRKKTIVLHVPSDPQT